MDARKFHGSRAIGRCLLAQRISCRNMIDGKFRVVVSEGGRMKAESEQTSPLTDRALEILDEIERRSGVAR